MRILIITDDELNGLGRETSLEHLGLEDLKTDINVVVDSQLMARNADAVIVARKLEGQNYYSLFAIKRKDSKGFGNRGPTPLINLSSIVAGELP